MTTIPLTLSQHSRMGNPPALRIIRVHADGLALSPDMAVAEYEADTRFSETVDFTALAFEDDVHGITVDMHDTKGNVLASHTFA